MSLENKISRSPAALVCTSFSGPLQLLIFVIPAQVEYNCSLTKVDCSVGDPEVDPRVFKPPGSARSFPFLIKVLSELK